MTPTSQVDSSSLYRRHVALVRGVCTRTDSSLDTLEIVSDEPGLVADTSVTSCINSH